MIRYYKKSLIDSTTTISIWKKWIMFGFILTIGLVNVNADERCCFSTNSELNPTSNLYRLNLTASHVDSQKGNNLYVAAIAFQPGYAVIGQPYSPFSKVTCSQESGAVPQYLCQSKDSKMFFISFDLSIQPPPSPNSTITASSVFIFGDKCQDVSFCTDLADKKDSEDTDKISLGPLGTWPKYAVIIGGVILGITLLVACYLVYKRNRPDDRFRDRSITPGSSRYDDKNARIFSPNSLLRTGGDDDLPPPSEEFPKNTLIQFGNTAAHSPERSKSVKNRNQQPTSLTKSPTKRKKEKNEKNHHEIEIHDHVKSDHDDNRMPSVTIEMSGNSNNNNNGTGNLDRSKSHKSRKSNSKDNNNVNRLSGYSTSDMSKTISNNDISDREFSDNNNDEFYSSYTTSKKQLSSTSLHRSKSKSRNSGEESRHNRKSSNNNSSSSNNNNGKPHRRSTSKGVEEDRDGRKVDRTTSRRHRSHSRTRKSTSPPPPASKSTSDLHKSSSTRRQTDRDLTSKNKKSSSDDKDAGKNNNVSSRSSANLDRKKSHRQRDLISHADTESTTSSSDIPLGDRLPLAMLVTKLPPSGQSNSWKPDKNNKNNKVDDDDDTTPLGQIGSFGAASTSSNSHLLSNDKVHDADDNDYYDSILNEVLGSTDYQNSDVDKNSDDDCPIGKSLPGIKEKECDEEIPIGRLRSN